MVATEATILTDRQREVLELREKGRTQKEVAEQLGTTDANVSAVERAAEKNVEKARRTLELVRTLRAPVRFTVPAGTSFDALVDEVYARGDDAGVKVAYCRPELYAHLYGMLEGHSSQNHLDTSVEMGLTEGGEAKVFTAEP
ncbi:transcriptional regulator [Halogeometricum pallidum JCM 14848]|uniref:Transcriptional regulator n=1 Tax=Halogeometricum pallidum JCM 14848 TaxID=1227487 RepID=M0D2Y6_HALPD|nr:Tfx family DNA-binding protein [Halogeometricum pallidum]ELZ29891.1 transcriptional regulator [Halogeometricum pallidum JCM 14848]